MEEQEGLGEERKKIKKIVIIAISILAVVLLIVYFCKDISINAKLAEYSKEAQTILYAIEYSDIKSLDSSKLEKIDNEILELSSKTDNKEIKQMLLNYHMGIGMMASNIDTDNSSVLSTIKSNLESAESKYKERLEKKNKEYEIIEKKEEYKKIDNYKLSDLIDISLMFSPEITTGTWLGIETYGRTGNYNISISVTNKISKEIKYVNLEIDICDKFQEKLHTKSYRLIGPISQTSNFKFNSQYISNYNIAEYIKISRVELTYTDNSIIVLEGDKIDKEAESVYF